MYTLQVSNCAHRAVAIRFGVVKFLVRMYATARGVWGHTPENFWGFRGYKCDCFCQRPFWANATLLKGQTTEFYMHEYLSFCPLRHTALVSPF